MSPPKVNSVLTPMDVRRLLSSCRIVVGFPLMLAAHRVIKRNALGGRDAGLYSTSHAWIVSLWLKRAAAH